MKENIKEIVREKYAQAIKEKLTCGQGSVGSSCCNNAFSQATDVISGNLYNQNEVSGLPQNIANMSFGCGNPTTLAEINAGEVVLDLGSGAGLDVLLSARRVGSSGKVYGLDMTDEMLAVARANQAKSGLDNIEFLKGHIENIPLPDKAVDVIISNCVINLSADKDMVFNEAYRVLKPGGRFAVADILLTKPLPERIQQDLMAWSGCIAGAMMERDYREKLENAGFKNIEVQITRVYDLDNLIGTEMLPAIDGLELEAVNGSIVSAFIRASKV